LYLIHWPLPSRDTYIDTYKAFEKLHADAPPGAGTFHRSPMPVPRKGERRPAAGRRRTGHPSGCPHAGQGMSSTGTRSRVPACLAASISQ
ncbi:hypothetical protein ABZ299_26195, partial [Streptomyces sp. NPDC006184]|uniref:hypothetical protein n=1 Tax=Streptomyces sp. NPDC006184 TaxID=3155455 RepID=UPI0033B6FCAF